MSKISRRHFFFGSLAATVPAGGFGSVPALARMGYRSPNEKLNIASIGAGNRPFAVLSSVAGDDHENIVALADVDFETGAKGFERWPSAAKYRDYREMLDKSGSDIDAVVIGTPDHMHATCALHCMELGKHIYVEKPLTRTPWEARLLEKAAKKYPKVATQMGNQGYSHDATRVAAEIIWSGEIGEIREVHAWQKPAIWPQGMATTPPATPVPDTLSWDLWLGGAAWREFTAGGPEYETFVTERRQRLGHNPDAYRGYGYYIPFNWRGFYDFGSGLIGDWGIHILGPANWALGLSPANLLSVECVSKDSLPPTTFPDELVLKYSFAARQNMPPVDVYWHNVQGEPYIPEGMTIEEARKIPDTGPQVDPPRNRPRRPDTGKPTLGYNLIFAGSKGYLGTNGRGEGVGLLPGSRWAEYELPPAYLPRSPGASTGSNMDAHTRDWVRACKGGTPACSNFGVAAPFTEWLVSGAAAVHCDGPLRWNNAKGEFFGNTEANNWVKPVFRKGWKIRL